MNWLAEVIRPAICCLQIWALTEIGNHFNVERLLNGRWFKLFTENSMGIYLLHQQFLYLLMRVFSNLPQMIFVLVSFVTTLICSCSLAIVIRKTKIGRVILGG